MTQKDTSSPLSKTDAALDADTDTFLKPVAADAPNRAEIYEAWVSAMRDGRHEAALRGLDANPRWGSSMSLSRALDSWCAPVVSRLAAELNIAKHATNLWMLDKAARDSSPECLRAILPYFDPKQVAPLSETGNTALMLAAQRNRYDNAKILLPLSDPRAVNKKGRSALQIALLGGHEETALALIPKSDLWASCVDDDAIPVDNAMHAAVLGGGYRSVRALAVRMGKKLTLRQWQHYWVLGAKIGHGTLIKEIGLCLNTFAPVPPDFEETALIASLRRHRQHSSLAQILPLSNVLEQVSNKATALSWALQRGNQTDFELIWTSVPASDHPKAALEALEGLCSIGVGDGDGLEMIERLFDIVEAQQAVGLGPAELLRRVEAEGRTLAPLKEWVGELRAKIEAMELKAVAVNIAEKSSAARAPGKRL